MNPGRHFPSRIFRPATLSFLACLILAASVFSAGCSFSPSYAATPTPTPVPTTPAPPTGYSNYNIAFNYSSSAKITALPQTGAPTPTADNGKIQIAEKGGADNFTIGWVKTNHRPTSILDFWNTQTHAAYLDKNLHDVTWGNVVKMNTTTGHDIYYGHMRYARVGKAGYINDDMLMWYCDETDRTFVVELATPSDEGVAKTTMTNLLNSFRCH